MCLAAADDVTRQRCMRIIRTASAVAASSSLHNIASAAALTPELFLMRSLPAVTAVVAALGKAAVGGLDLPALRAAGVKVECIAEGIDLCSLIAAGFTSKDVKEAKVGVRRLIDDGCDACQIKDLGITVDAAAFRAAGCDWTTVRAKGFTATQVKAAGCDLTSAQSADYDVGSLVAAFGYDACAAAGCDVSSVVIVSRAPALLHAHTCARRGPRPLTLPPTSLSLHFSATAPTCT